MLLWPWQYPPKAWWSCQLWWKVDSYVWCSIPQQGPGNFCKSQQWHLLSHHRATQRCIHPLDEDIWCTSPLAGSSWVWGSCCWGDIEGLGVSQEEVVGKEPWGWALWHLLQLHSLMASWASCFTVSEHQEGVTITQGDGGSMARTSSPMNVVNSSMHFLSYLTHSASCYSLPGNVGLAALAQCCMALAYAKVFSGCFKW